MGCARVSVTAGSRHCDAGSQHHSGTMRAMYRNPWMIPWRSRCSSERMSIAPGRHRRRRLLGSEPFEPRAPPGEAALQFCEAPWACRAHRSATTPCCWVDRPAPSCPRPAAGDVAEVGHRAQHPRHQPRDLLDVQRLRHRFGHERFQPVPPPGNRSASSSQTAQSGVGVAPR
jgi:hypothetical protein